MKNNWPIFLILFVSIVIFFPFFTSGRFPIPTNYLVTWFEPWKTEYGHSEKPNIPHKPVASDVIRQIYPLRNLAFDFIRSGLAPLWNPYNGAGQPLLATSHIAVLNPWSLVQLLLPGVMGWSVFIVIQPLILGLAMYFYLGIIQISVWGRIISTVLLLFSGFAGIRYIYGDYVYALTYLPLILSLLEADLRKKYLLPLILLPFLVCFLLLSVQQQISLYILVFSALYYLFRLGKIDLIKITKLGFHYLAGFMFASVQILPTFELYRYSAISAGTSGFIFDRFLMPIGHVLTLAIPNFFGNAGTYNYWGAGDYVETVLYVGLLCMFLALLPFISGKMKNPLFKIFGLAVIITIFLTLENPVAEFIYGLGWPILSTGIPTRIYLLTTFCVTVLAGMGWDEFVGNRINSVSFRKALVLFVFPILLVLIYLYLRNKTNAVCPVPEVPDCYRVALRNTILEAGYFAAGMAALILYRLRLINLKILGAGICGLIIIWGSYNTAKFMPWSDFTDAYPRTDLVSAIKKFQGYGRVFGLDKSNLKTDISCAIGIFDPNYYDPLYIKRYGELVSYAIYGRRDQVARSDVEIPWDFEMENDGNIRRKKLLALLGVRLITTDDSGKLPADMEYPVIWGNNHWKILKSDSPRAYIVNDVKVIKDPDRILESLFDKNFDVASQVILEENPGIAVNHSRILSTTRIVRYEPNRVEILARSSGSALLVLNDNFFPGWSADVDGKPAKIFRANYTFRAVALPGGEHKISFLYEPLSFKLGMAVSAGSVFIWFIYAGFSWYRLRFLPTREV